MSKYIIDILGEVDEELLEEALDLPQQADEIVIESDERRRRGSIFGAAAAIAVSLAVVAGVVLFRANFGRIAALPNESNLTDISTPDDFSGGIVIPNKFTEDDKELRQILNDIDSDALKLCKAFGYYPQRTYESRRTYYFLFPQMAKPITYQFDKYPYYIDIMLSNGTLHKWLTDSFTAEAVEKFTKDIGKGVIITGSADEPDFTVSITEGGEFDENGYLIAPPGTIEMEDGSIYPRARYNGRDFSGYWSTAKVISRTDDEFIFSYIYEFDGELCEAKGRLLNENGWKFSWYGDWIF